VLLILISENKLRNQGQSGIPFSVNTGKVLAKGSWRTFKPVIDYKKCIKCLMCWLYCPDSAYSLNKKGYPICDYKVCKGCLICGNICPVKCIKKERDFHRGKP